MSSSPVKVPSSNPSFARFTPPLCDFLSQGDPDVPVTLTSRLEDNRKLMTELCPGASEVLKALEEQEATMKEAIINAPAHNKLQPITQLSEHKVEYMCANTYLKITSGDVLKAMTPEELAVRMPNPRLKLKLRDYQEQVKKHGMPSLIFCIPHTSLLCPCLNLFSPSGGCWREKKAIRR